jgi:hypothetical protein
MKRIPDLRLTYSAGTGSNCGQTVDARDPGTGTAGTRQGWSAANRARRKYGHKKAIAMLAFKISRHSGQDIASLFGTTRGAVYQRLFRLRTGRYTAFL